MNTVACDIGKRCKRTINLTEKALIGSESSMSMLPILGSFGPGLLLDYSRNLRIQTFNISEI